MSLDVIGLILAVLTIFGALAGPRLLFQLFFPHVYPRVYDSNVRAGITYDGPELSEDIQEYPWDMLNPLTDGNDSIWVRNNGEHPLKFEVEFEIEEQHHSWPINRQVRLEQVFQEAVPGKGLSLIARPFTLSPGGGRNFTFPYVPHSESCILTITVFPSLDPSRLGIPNYLADYFGEVQLRQVKRVYKITADEDTIEQFTPYP